MASLAYPSLAKKTSLKDGTTYGYAYVKAHANKPTLLFLHGYPSSSYDWRHQVPYFSERGYGLVVPDLLGYGDTSKPVELVHYGTKNMGNHVIELLDQEGIGKVIGIAHDWGCGLLSAMVKFHQDRFLSFAFTSVGYLPSSFENIDEINRQTQETIGYPIFGYWKFHEQEDAGDVIAKHSESCVSLMYCDDPAEWKTHICPIGENRRFAEADETVAKASYISAAEFEMHDKILLGMGGYTAPLKWYKQAIRGISSKEEEDVTEEQKRIHKPVLFVRSERDYICLPDMMEQGMKPYVDSGNLYVESLNTSHWAMLEMPNEYNQILEKFVERAGRGS